MTVDQLVALARAGGLWAVQPQRVDPSMWEFGRVGDPQVCLVRLRDEDPDRIVRTHARLVADFGLPPLPVQPAVDARWIDVIRRFRRRSRH